MCPRTKELPCAIHITVQLFVLYEEMKCAFNTIMANLCNFTAHVCVLELLMLGILQSVWMEKL